MELLFVSARSSRKDKTSPALLYRLDDERDLPEPSQSHPWAGKNVSALRDRLMIEWVMSLSQSKKLLKRMVDEVTSCIRRYGQSSSSAGKSTTGIVCVVVTCSNGAQLSPCFVEKLYEHFSSGRSDLQVRRDHRDALRGDWGRSKNKRWQVSCVPINKIIASNFPVVFQSKMWLDFDLTANAETEAQFKKDPFNSCVEFTDMILDFEGGTWYRKTDKKTYYIRSLDVSQSKVNCWMLTGSGYKSATSRFKGAGIQPYSIHPVTGEAIFLLGRLTYGQFIWSDFGGFKSHRFMREGPRFTAARECFEETLGILGTTKELAETLINFKTNNCFKVVNVETSYVEHYMRIPYRDYPLLFRKRLSEMEDKLVEVDRMKWFSLSSLKDAVLLAHSEQLPRYIQAQAIREDGTEEGSHNLREPYVCTMCIADTLNFLDSIAAIAKSEHRKQDTHTRHHGPSQEMSSDFSSDFSITKENESSDASGSNSAEEVTTKHEKLAGDDATLIASAVEPTETLVLGEDSVSSEDSSDSDDGSEVTHEASSNNSATSNRESEGGSTIEYTEERESDSVRDKEKPLELPGRRKKGHYHFHGHQDKAQPWKRNRGRRKTLSLYGMGAGSFTGREHYMNT